MTNTPAPKKISPKRQRAADMFFAGSTYQQVADALGMTRGAVAGCVRDARPDDIPPKPNNRPLPETIAAVDLVRAGWTQAQAARLIGINACVISRALWRERQR